MTMLVENIVLIRGVLQLDWYQNVRGLEYSCTLSYVNENHSYLSHYPHHQDCHLINLFWNCICGLL